MQLRAALPLLFGLVGVLGTAQADEQMPQNPSGELQIRGNYWRDRNTRVITPTASFNRDVTDRVNVGVHYTLDAITSASIAAGASSDQPFTELRHEAGFVTSIGLSRSARLTADYRYSTESDYWSHTAGLRLNLDLFQATTNLLFGVDFSDNVVGKRLGPTGYLLEGRLETVHIPLLISRIFTRTLIGTFSEELTVADGFQNNVYRPVSVSGEQREFENLPTLRVRNMMAASLHWMLPFDNRIVPHLTLRPAFRFYIDCWGVKAFIPELATYVPVGPVELRLLIAYYGQLQADFYRAEGGGRMGYVEGTPSYANGPVDFNQCGVHQQVFTSDVKLSTYNTGTFELQVKWRLSALRRVPQVGGWLGRSAVELMGGIWAADQAVGWQYGLPLSGNDPLAPSGCSLQCAAFYAALGLYMPL